MVTISPRQEEVLSYLCGLAPVGEPIQVRNKWLVTDFANMHHTNFCIVVRRLVRKGAVEVLVKGTGSTPSVLRVVKRPEAFEFKGYPLRMPSRLLRFAGYDATEAA